MRGSDLEGTADAVGLGGQLPFQVGEAALLVAAVGGELALLVFGEAEVELRVGVLCPLGPDAGLPREEDALEVVGLAPAAAGEALGDAAKSLLAPFAEGGEEVFEVAGRGGEEARVGGTTSSTR